MNSLWSGVGSAGIMPRQYNVVNVDVRSDVVATVVICLVITLILPPLNWLLHRGT